MSSLALHVHVNTQVCGSLSFYWRVISQPIESGRISLSFNRNLKLIHLERQTMNPTFDYNSTQRNADRAGSRQSAQTFAASDARSAAPDLNQPYTGEQAIANSFKPLLGVHRYWARPTFVAMVATLLLVLISLALPYFFSPSLPLTGVLAFTISAAVISGYHWIFKKWGPAKITEERFPQAKEELADSGDEHKKPVELLEMLLLTAVMTIDGFLSGSSLVESVFAHLFTPRMAMLAAVAWGVGATALLYKLIMDAATAAAINERRGIIRQLSASADPDDQAQAVAMKKAVGGKLGNNFSTHANSYFAQGALAVCVVVLAGSTFLLRVNAPADGEPQEKANPAIAQPAFLRT